MSFSDPFPERAMLALRMVVPYLLLVVLFILNVVSLSDTYSGSIKAPFFLMAIYYWSVFRPSLLPVWLVFACGILLDLLSGTPIGLSALVYVLVRWTIADQQRFLMAQPFVMLWSIFGLVTIMTYLLQWLLFGLTHLTWLPLGSILVSALLGIVLFPLIHLLLHATHKALPG